ncbi:MAG: thioredoxin [Lasallia pustulata]|uniref:Thioredoxin n=1 Tax=Lasallia pustulata TaxID=136370 RepID=A0A1W5CXZ0_9LECA|nr:MAG: thioredoxin [Lasallia pustulata]SLM35733.1 thioredoxin-like protein [Lasallia pustulata]
MAQLDSKVASVLDKSHNEDDEDALLDSLENDPSLDGFREQRLQQLHSEFTRAKQMRSQEHGTYVEIKDEKALMDITTSTKLCVVHFFKPDFNRCRIMDEHLQTLAPKHFDTRFLRTNVENCPFLVTKLKIQVLPCVLAFENGISADRVIGFEGLGHSEDTFTTRDLEARLLRAGVLVRAKTVGNEVMNRMKKQQEAEDAGDDDDWD